MASTADVRFAQLQQDEANALAEQQRRQQASLQKRRSRMGFGRFAGMAAGTLLGLATGGGSLLVGALAGAGSRLGSEAGMKSSKIDEVDKGKLYRQQAQDARDQGRAAQRQLIQSANVGALSDAFSAGTFAGTNAGQTVGNVLQEGSFAGVKDAFKQGAVNAANIEGEGIKAAIQRTGERFKPVGEYFKSFAPDSERMNPLQTAINNTGVELNNKFTLPQFDVDLLSNAVSNFASRNFESELDKFRSNNPSMAGNMAPSSTMFQPDADRILSMDSRLLPNLTYQPIR